MHTENFGWLPQIASFGGSLFKIDPLFSRPSEFDYITNSVRTKNDWFYPPLEPEYWSAGTNSQPLLYAEWFALPATHCLTFLHDEDDPVRLAALCAEVLGAIKGLQLLLEGWGHFYRTPVKPNLLGDIQTVKPAAVSRILDLAIEFWRANQSARKNVYGAVHWHIVGPSYQHSFETFSAAYSVLDACWAVHSQLGRARSARVPHAERLPIMCSFYDLQVPRWAVVSAGKSRLSELRNDYLHESLWAGEPIGFSNPRDVPSIDLELFCFNTRLILAILGERSSYTRSEITLQSFALE